MITPYRRINRLREQANYRQNGVQRNALDDFERGQRLNERSLKQLHHAVHLLAHQAQQNQREQAEIRKLRNNGLNQLAQADLKRHLQTTKQDPEKGDFAYKGQTFDIQDGVQVMLAEHEYFAAKDRFMTNAEVKALKDRIEFEKGTIAGAASPVEQSLEEPLPSRNQTKDGYVVLGRQAYGSKEASSILSSGKELKPLPYPTNPNLPKSAYPDVTQRVNSLLKQMESDLNPFKQDRLSSYPWFNENFGNNAKWDLQVNYGLPGQVPIIQNGKYIRDKQGFIETNDQYALFKGRVVRAGYISNYAFGYASAHAGFLRDEPIFISEIVAIGGSKDGDNPADLQAILHGWNAYHGFPDQ